MQRTFIINRQTGKVVWQYLHKSSASEEETSGQEGKGAHTVKMLPNGHLFFLKNKNLLKFSETSFSSVEELNPVTEKVEWRYMANPATVFKTPLWGGAYQLPNGNALITNSTSGSAFEVTREGRLVWEWVNPARDEFGLPLPIYRVNRVSKQLADQIIKKWKEFE